MIVAVTGPTGDIGRAFLRALDAAPEIDQVIGMARRPFDTAAAGLSDKVVYRRGDILDADALDSAFAGADVVVHLAFIIFGSGDETHEINVRGSRQTFEAAIRAGAQRLVYTSSVAAYGFHADNPQPLTEDIAPRGSENMTYSAHKGELEGVLTDVLAAAGDAAPDAYVFRPCIVAGGDALLLIRQLPYVQASDRLPDPIRGLLRAAPGKPVLPDPGVPFQLVHTDDVASALVAAAVVRGVPGIYNLAGDGEISMRDFARELGWWSVPLPQLAVGATAELVARAPLMPSIMEWLTAFRVPVIMSTAKARDQLGWAPVHDTAATLHDTVVSGRTAGLV